MAEMGRPTAYKEEYNDQAYKFSLLGATDKQMADFFSIAERTLNYWKEEYPYFLQSIKDGKTKADAEIADALFHRAKGYEHDDLYIAQYKGQIVTHEYTKHYPPDTAAAFIWLKNRQRAIWKDWKDGPMDIENAEEHFKACADAIAQSDTNPDAVLP